MHQNALRNANMNKENIVRAKMEEPTSRITRARAKTLGLSGRLPPLKPSVKQEQNQTLQLKSKRTASDENRSTVNITICPQQKKRAVLKGVTNVGDNTYRERSKATKTQPSKKANHKTIAKISPAVLVEKSQITEDITKLRIAKSEVTLSVDLGENSRSLSSSFIGVQESVVEDIKHSSKTIRQQSTKQQEVVNLGKKLEVSDGLGFTDIDSNHKEPLMCSLYAPDIYTNLRVTELNRRPSTNYLARLQCDITQGMRGILIDWLVEVSEEYRLVPDTLYLTVNLIDRFLSENYIEKQKLQLLGVTCMLIASKYEEICAPRVEEFSFITDNTYTRGEVLIMESRVLNFLGFQLSVPTTKKFLRRFIQAAQVSYEVPSVKLEFLANYVAELSLLDYSFLKFLPSATAASAVFLARWTLDQSDHPWNPTLEHYTSYKASELKVTVLALQELLLNTNGCSLNAIREKYRQEKFESVATLSSPKSAESLF